MNFYDKNELTLSYGHAMEGSYGQAKFNLAWYKNEFDAYNVFVANSGEIDMIEIYTPGSSDHE